MKTGRIILAALTILSLNFVGCDKEKTGFTESIIKVDLEGEWILNQEMPFGGWRCGDMYYDFSLGHDSLCFNNGICTMTSLFTSSLFPSPSPNEVKSRYTREINNIILENGIVFKVIEYDENAGILMLTYEGNSFAVHRKATDIPFEGVWESQKETSGYYKGLYVIYRTDKNHITSFTPFRMSFNGDNCTLSSNLAELISGPTETEVTYKYEFNKGDPFRRIILDGISKDFEIYLRDYNPVSQIISLRCASYADDKNLFFHMKKVQ